MNDRGNYKKIIKSYKNGYNKSERNRKGAKKMDIIILKKVDYTTRLGDMMLKIRLSNNDLDKIEEIYRKYGMADREGHVINMNYKFTEIDEQSYQTNTGVPYSKNFPNLIARKQKIDEFVAIITAPAKVEFGKSNVIRISGEKIITRIEMYKEELINAGVKEEEMIFWKEWTKENPILNRLSYQELVTNKDYIMLDFSKHMEYRDEMVQQRKKMEKKYGVNPKHWHIEQN